MLPPPLPPSPSQRASGYNLSYSLASGLLGGLTPLAVTAIRTSSAAGAVADYAAAYWQLAAAGVSVLAYLAALVRAGEKGYALAGAADCALGVLLQLRYQAPFAWRRACCLQIFNLSSHPTPRQVTFPQTNSARAVPVEAEPETDADGIARIKARLACAPAAPAPNAPVRRRRGGDANC